MTLLASQLNKGSKQVKTSHDLKIGDVVILHDGLGDSKRVVVLGFQGKKLIVIKSAEFTKKQKNKKSSVDVLGRYYEDLGLIAYGGGLWSSTNWVEATGSNVQNEELCSELASTYKG